jgi:hypothetical protein
MSELIVTIVHRLQDDDPSLTDSLGELLRDFESLGVVIDFSFKNETKEA